MSQISKGKCDVCGQLVARLPSGELFSHRGLNPFTGGKFNGPCGGKAVALSLVSEEAPTKAKKKKKKRLFSK